MFEKIFGKKNSIQRSLLKNFFIVIITIIIINITGFLLLVAPSINMINNAENISEILYMIRKYLGLAIFNIILISAIFIRINTKKMLQPIQKLSEATKKVSSRRL